MLSKSALHAFAIVAVLVASAAHAAATSQQLDVDWQQDGHTVMTATKRITLPLAPTTPIYIASGDSVPYATCTPSGASFSLQSNRQFVGRALTVRPVAAQNSQIQFEIEASDTTLVEIKQVDSGPCKSEVVETAGMKPVKLTATVEEGKVATVPFPDGHGELRLKLHTVE